MYMSVQIVETATYNSTYRESTVIRGSGKCVNYTPGIYAEGHIVFAFPFVRSYVRLFLSSFLRS